MPPSHGNLRLVSLCCSNDPSSHLLLDCVPCDVLLECKVTNNQPRKSKRRRQSSSTKSPSGTSGAFFARDAPHYHFNSQSTLSPPAIRRVNDSGESSLVQFNCFYSCMLHALYVDLVHLYRSNVALTTRALFSVPSAFFSILLSC